MKLNVDVITLVKIMECLNKKYLVKILMDIQALGDQSKHGGLFANLNFFLKIFEWTMFQSLPQDDVIIMASLKIPPTFVQKLWVIQRGLILAKSLYIPVNKVMCKRVLLKRKKTHCLVATLLNFKWVASPSSNFRTFFFFAVFFTEICRDLSRFCKCGNNNLKQMY